MKDGVLTFVGLWEEMEALVEMDELPVDVLAANPTIQTFRKVDRFKLFYDGSSRVLMLR